MVPNATHTPKENYRKMGMGKREDVGSNGHPSDEELYAEKAAKQAEFLKKQDAAQNMVRPFPSGGDARLRRGSGPGRLRAIMRRGCVEERGRLLQMLTTRMPAGDNLVWGLVRICIGAHGPKNT